MKNKNLIYVAIGLGAGVFAYYYFCRKKYRLNGVAGNITEGDELSSESASEDGKPISGSYNPTGRALAPPPLSNPISIIREIIAPISTVFTNPSSTTGTTNPVTTPILATGTTTPISKTDTTSPVISTGTTSPVISTGTTSPVITTDTTSPVISTGTTSPVITTDATSVDKPALTTDVITKENAIAPTRTLATDIKTTEPIKSGFDGMGQLCFEVGECLYDL